MALDAVGTGNHQNGVIQHLQGTLHLGGKVHMAWGVHQRDLHLGQGQDRLFGENGNAPLPLQIVVVQKGILVIHPAQLIDAAAQVEHTL